MINDEISKKKKISHLLHDLQDNLYLCLSFQHWLPLNPCENRENQAMHSCSYKKKEERHMINTCISILLGFFPKARIKNTSEARHRNVSVVLTVGGWGVMADGLNPGVWEHPGKYSKTSSQNKNRSKKMFVPDCGHVPGIKCLLYKTDGLSLEPKNILVCSYIGKWGAELGEGLFAHS